MDNVNIFINYVLPYCFTKIDKNYIDAIDKLEFLSGGAYGLTFYYNSTVIKILFLDDNIFFKKSFGKIEVTNLFSLFFDNDGTHINDIPSSINDIHSYFTTDNEIMKTININANFPKTNIKFDENLKTKIYEQLNKYGDIPIFVLFMDKATMSFPEFISNIEKLHIDVKLKILKTFLNNMYEAFNYMHNLGFIHSDLSNSANIVVNIDNNNYENAKFQLIDFGLMQRTNSINKKVNRNTDPAYIEFSNKYKNTTSIVYDWLCMLQLLLYIYNNIILPLKNLTLEQLEESINADVLSNKQKQDKLRGEINIDKDKIIQDIKYIEFRNSYANFYFVLTYTRILEEIDKPITFYLTNNVERTVNNNQEYEIFLGDLIHAISDSIQN